jgi:hypothetical protein
MLPNEEKKNEQTRSVHEMHGSDGEQRDSPETGDSGEKEDVEKQPDMEETLKHLSEELSSLEQAFLLRWENMKDMSYHELGPRKDNPEQSIRYATGRDCVNVFRFCYPAAARLAATLKPEWASDDSAMADIIYRYVTCFTEQEFQFEAIGGALPALLESEEHMEAFAAFSCAYMAVQLVYMAFTPHLIQAFPRTWPETADRALDALVEAALMPKKKTRENIIRRGMENGFLPRNRKFLRFARYTCTHLLSDMVEKFLAGGYLILDRDVSIDDLDLPQAVKDRLKHAENSKGEKHGASARARKTER